MKKVFDSNSEYHSHSCISASGLKTIFDLKGSVRDYLAKTYEDKEAYRFGNLVHVLFTEGRSEYQKQYYEMPEIGHLRKTETTTSEEAAENRKLKEQLIKKAGNKIVVDFKDVQTIRELEAQFMADDEVGRTARESCEGIYELSHYTKYDGIDVRVRPDIINEEKGFIADIKSTRDLVNFNKEINWYHYDLQAAFYCTVLGYDIEKFRFVILKNHIQYSNPQYREQMVDVVSLNEREIERGFYKLDFAWNQWKRYINEGVAPGVDLDRNQYGIKIYP